MEVVSRIENNKWSIPVFEDELHYREHPDLPPKRWTVAMWAGEYAREPWEASGVRFFEFLEPSGRWRLCWLRRPRSVRAAGYKGKIRDRKQVATIVLMPNPSFVLGAAPIDRGPEIAFDDAVSLIRDIRDNRKLALNGIPIRISDPEIAWELEDHPSIPPGKTTLESRVWVDHSKKGRKTGGPELETNDWSKAKKIAMALPALKLAPNLVDEIAALKEEQRRAREDLDEILRLLRSRN